MPADLRKLFLGERAEEIRREMQAEEKERQDKMLAVKAFINVQKHSCVSQSGPRESREFMSTSSLVYEIQMVHGRDLMIELTVSIAGWKTFICFPEKKPGSARYLKQLLGDLNIPYLIYPDKSRLTSQVYFQYDEAPLLIGAHVQSLLDKVAREADRSRKKQSDLLR
jgi:hypothetical protein